MGKAFYLGICTSHKAGYLLSLQVIISLVGGRSPSAASKRSVSNFRLLCSSWNACMIFETRLAKNCVKQKVCAAYDGSVIVLNQTAEAANRPQAWFMNQRGGHQWNLVKNSNASSPVWAHARAKPAPNKYAALKTCHFWTRPHKNEDFIRSTSKRFSSVLQVCPVDVLLQDGSPSGHAMKSSTHITDLHPKRLGPSCSIWYTKRKLRIFMMCTGHDSKNFNGKHLHMAREHIRIASTKSLDSLLLLPNVYPLKLSMSDWLEKSQFDIRKEVLESGYFLPSMQESYNTIWSL